MIIFQTFFIFGFFQHYVSKSNSNTLRFVSLLYRHGDRTPIDFYPTDPYRDPSEWPVGPGQLTKNGKIKQYKLGKFFRSRYENFLNFSYDEKEIYVRSTDVDRTLMSAEVNLAGLYEPTGTENWSPEIHWTPIPIHTVEEKNDFLNSQANCPAYSSFLKDVLSTDPILLSYSKKYKWLYSLLSEYTGETINTPSGVSYIYDTLEIEKSFGKILPNWTTTIFPEKMREMHELSFFIPTWTKELKRFKGGSILSFILKGFNNFIRKKKNSKKMLMISGHDITVADLLNTLGVYNGKPPAFASSVLLEFHEMSPSQFFIFLYQFDDSTVAPIPLHVLGCETPCSLETFLNVTKHVIPEDWKSECHKNEFSLMNLYLILTMSIAFCLFFFLFFRIRKRRWRNNEYSSLHNFQG